MGQTGRQSRQSPQSPISEQLYHKAYAWYWYNGSKTDGKRGNRQYERTWHKKAHIASTIARKAAPVIIQEPTLDADAAAQAAQLLRSEYGRAAIAAYVQGWLGEDDVRYSKDLGIQDDKSYIMSLLAVLTSGDPTAEHQIKELGGTFSEKRLLMRKRRNNG